MRLLSRTPLAAFTALSFLFPVSPSAVADPARHPVDPRLFGSGQPPHLQRPDHFHGPRIPHVAQRGLAVIADFADRRLEDWAGPGFTRPDQISDQLKRMSEHWAWLSRGQERFQWDIVRVTLPQTLRPDAYPDWSAYRDAVAALVRQRVNAARYDTNRDGVIDTVWIIAANQGQAYDYLIGGTSRNAGANVFVDVQDGLSVTGGHTGNFNHEVAHTLGVPDLYGPYDTVHYLTLMSDSWALPPQDVTAYERSLLGWVTPRTLPTGLAHARLLPTDTRADALRISTARPAEYFLIEYRRRPDSGFGSGAPAYDGLAVYHVFEGSGQQVDPPLLKLEAADGAIAPDALPEATDFLTPENPALAPPFVARSYFGGQPVFRLTRLQRGRDGSLAFDVQVLPATLAAGDNLLSNPSFEQGANVMPKDWGVAAWAPSVSFGWERRPVQDGRRSVSITAATPNDARWEQSVSGLDPARSYGFCGWLRGSGIRTAPDAPVGANLSVLGGFERSASFDGSFDWQQTCMSFRPAADTATLTCRLGFYGSTVTGKAWCDNLSLVPLHSAFTP